MSRASKGKAREGKASKVKEGLDWERQGKGGQRKAGKRRRTQGKEWEGEGQARPGNRRQGE